MMSYDLKSEPTTKKTAGSKKSTGQKLRIKPSMEKTMIADAIEMEEKIKKHADAIEAALSSGEKALLEHLGKYVEEPFTIIESYFDGQHLERLVRHQIESYNDFVNNQIQRTIDMFNPVIIASEQDMCRRTKKNKLELINKIMMS